MVPLFLDAGRMHMKKTVMLTLCAVLFQVYGASAAQGDPAAAIETYSWSSQFSTDFTRHIIDYSDILSGGPPKDGIPSIDSPKFIPIHQASDWIKPQEPVILLPDINGESRIYPIQILMWHEIVNDRIQGKPVAVTYCPLCTTGVVFSAQVGDMHLDFGVTGLLRYSNMIMYDRYSESWWQQATGAALAGKFTGENLEILPSLTLSFENASAGHPDALVLSRDTEFMRAYGRNPYIGYDTSGIPFLYQGPGIDESMEMLDRVIALRVNGEVDAVSYALLKEEHLVEREIGGKPVAVFWVPGTSSALDAGDISSGRDIGSANAFFSQLGNLKLEFQYLGGDFIDIQTGTRWNTTGKATAGDLQGESLVPVTAVEHFWFSYQAFMNEFGSFGQE